MRYRGMGYGDGFDHGVANGNGWGSGDNCNFGDGNGYGGNVGNGVGTGLPVNLPFPEYTFRLGCGHHMGYGADNGNGMGDGTLHHEMLCHDTTDLLSILINQQTEFTTHQVPT